MSVRNPEDKSSVWPLPRSLAATRGIDVSFSSSGYLDVSVPRVTFSMAILFTIGYLSITLSEFPHSEICGSMDMCSLPQLIAACHVLLRLPVPRHPPYALLYLTCKVHTRCVLSLLILNEKFWFSRLKSYITLCKSLKTHLVFNISISFFFCVCLIHVIRFSRFS